MAKRVIYVGGQPACPKCGSTNFRNKSVLEFGRSAIQCTGCGTGLLPATGRDVRAARRDMRAQPTSAPHQHDWRDRTTAEDRRTSRVRVDECVGCGERRMTQV